MEFEQLQTARLREEDDLESELKTVAALEDRLRAKQSANQEEAERMEAAQTRLDRLLKQLHGAQTALNVHRQNVRSTEASCREQKYVSFCSRSLA